MIDVDDYALTAGVIAAGPDGVRMLAQAAWPRASLKLWKDRLLDAICDRCVRLCRRDPRDMPAAEQDLFDQLDAALDRAAAGPGVTLTVRSEHWLQELPHTAADFDGYCATLAQLAATGVADLVRSVHSATPPRAVWLTHRAARLPGLLAGVTKVLPDSPRVRPLLPAACAEAAAALPAGPHAADALTLDAGRVPAGRGV